MLEAFTLWKSVLKSEIIGHAEDNSEWLPLFLGVREGL